MARKKSAGAKYFGKPLTDDPDDAPELLNNFLRHGELRHGGTLIRRGRPPLSGKPKPRSRFGSMKMREGLSRDRRGLADADQRRSQACAQAQLRATAAPRRGKPGSAAARTASQTKV
jgi:hypothetical protein